MAPLKIALVLAVLLAIGTDTAVAATVKVERRYNKAEYVGDGLYLRAAPGEVNDVTMVQAGFVVTVTDSVPLQPGLACEAQSPFEVRCTVGVSRGFLLDARLGDGDDALRVAELGDAHFTKLFGGPGDDHLVGMTNGENRFWGGPGDDVMEGGAHSDAFEEDTDRNGSDTMLGGSPGSPPSLLSDDSVDYGLRSHSIRITMDGAANDGERGEHDRIGTDVERVVTGSGADVLLGNAVANDLVGGPGRDLLRGGAGDDHLVGDEYMPRGKRQEDVIRGGPGADRLEGGIGADRLSPGPGHDSILTGTGADRVGTRDGLLDAVLCGDGRARILNDASDWLSAGCQPQGGRIPARVVPLFWADGGDRLFLVLGCPFHKGVTCQADATLEVEGQTFGPRSFSLASGRYAWLLLSLGGRTAENPDPPLDGAVVVLRSADRRGRVASVRIPLSAVHREASYLGFFLPPVVPFL